MTTYYCNLLIIVRVFVEIVFSILNSRRAVATFNVVQLPNFNCWLRRRTNEFKCYENSNMIHVFKQSFKKFNNYLSPLLVE